MLSIFLSAEFLGYYTNALFIHSSYISNPIFFYNFGALFILFGILDILLFAFGPAPLQIYID